MRINFKRSGGFAAVPGLSRPVEIDTDDLTHEKAKEVKGMVEAARSLDHHAAAPADSKSRDACNYTVEIEDGGEKHVIQTQDGNIPAPLQPLINWLSAEHNKSVRERAGKADDAKA
jgi:hypothetical protein